MGLLCGKPGEPACPTRPDGTPGNGRPHEAVKPAVACPSLINPQCPEYTGGTSGGGGGTGSNGGSSSTQKAS